MKKQTATILKQLGVPPHKTGYAYIGEAAEMICEDRRNLHKVTTEIYPAIAKKYGTTPSAVERAIRIAIEGGMNNLGAEQVEEFFGNTIHFDKGKPTSVHFLAIVVEMMEE